MLRRNFWKIVFRLLPAVIGPSMDAMPSMGSCHGVRWFERPIYHLPGGKNNEPNTDWDRVRRQPVLRSRDISAGGGRKPGPPRLRHATGADGRQRTLLGHLRLPRPEASVRLQLLS